MTGQAQLNATPSAAIETLLAFVAAEGAGAHRYIASDALRRGVDAGRNAADLVHHLALLHGRHPGIVDDAVARTADPAARGFVETAAIAFAEERALLARLVVAVGPLPSTSGHADAESAVLHQHHALEMLGRSDRNGCATGAALALMADWAAIRPLLDHVAERLGLDPVPHRLASPDAIGRALAAVAFGMAAERAMLFGAQQVVAQHRGLWDLLEARTLARIDH